MIIIVDFGSQYNQLIARRVRELGVFSTVEPPDIALSKIEETNPEGIILSGGPASVYEDSSPSVHPKIFELGIPVLGICYGFQFMVASLGGKVVPAKKREYGFALLRVKNGAGVFEGVPSESQCWMSHGDTIVELPEGFEISASTENTEIAAAADVKRRLYGLQFHPEVAHTAYGKKMIENFLFSVCGCRREWSLKSFVDQTVKDIREQVGDRKVIMGISGGVDSTVAAVIIHRAIGDRLIPVFIDNGLMREGEMKRIREIYQRNLHIKVRFLKKGRVFLKRLRGVKDPERKRKIIGSTFVEIFEEEARKVKGIAFLAQGTLYPDVIESRSAFGGPSAVIKSHHNVGGLPKKMKLRLIEPLRFLFKDEVRQLGLELGLPEDMIWRQPFPGPGLAVRIIGEVTERRLSVLRKADRILLDEIKRAGLYRNLWQSFAVLLPVKTVGIMGDRRTYENIIAIRAVTSEDAMTADWARLPYEVLGSIANRIINEVPGVNRVVYDLSSKPPSTIEWE
ncbi:MAG: glutamine-hydrolyzing GMP synthase [Syntrophales bacterium]|nr:glutamine-hydrolyzing GMP synthase [Syntrophales bacterium]